MVVKTLCVCGIEFSSSCVDIVIAEKTTEPPIPFSENETSKVFQRTLTLLGVPRLTNSPHVVILELREAVRFQICFEMQRFGINLCVRSCVGKLHKTSKGLLIDRRSLRPREGDT